MSTLIKWFPDRRGMATGMAIMGFGGGAMIGAPLADRLMRFFASPTSVGVWQTLLTLAAIYFVFMMAGALSYRVPPPDWRPAGWTPPSRLRRSALVTPYHVHVNRSWRTPQFWLVWGVLCLNVSAGIGVLGMASPLLQEVFGGRLIGVDAGFGALDPGQREQITAIGAGFTGLLSLFNIGGRFFWAALSDRLGRKRTYSIFFVLGMALYLAIPSLARGANLALFVAAFCIILSMYGGGFATVPAYLADLFGTHVVGAIHGRLLTAWSVAGIFGPQLVNYVREYQIGHGLDRAQAYDTTMHVMAAMLLGGLVCNLLVRPVAHHHAMDAAQLRAEAAPPAPAGARTGAVAATRARPAVIVLAWATLAVPVMFGIWITLQKAAILFR